LIETPIIHIRPTDSAFLQPHKYQVSASGSFQSPPPIFGITCLHISPQHRRSRFSNRVFRLFRRSYPDSIIWHSELTGTFCCGPSSNYMYVIRSH